ncbi:DNA repair protein Rad4p [Cryptosporidium ryanae]|uniref:DNA repair protein Rad4p n=1 Tax=Cryptosporidium ryanae TaxID=515981 RepID=UPI00351A9191|nr:DNA repair protein Rad4p [Cryptosporidium ryanae]
MQKITNVFRCVYALCWLIHLRLLNKLVDNLYIQSHILSVYFCYSSGKKTKNLKEIYTWFRKYFKTYYLPNDYWLYKFDLNKKTGSGKDLNYSAKLNKLHDSIFGVNDDDNLKEFRTKLSEINGLVSTYKLSNRTFFFALITKRIISSIITGNCGSEISNIIFAALLRSLGFYCRLTLLIPPIINFKNKTKLSDNNRRPELWVEVFDPSFNKWISIDIHRGGWNFTGCKGMNIVLQSTKEIENKNERKSSGIFSKLFLNIGNDSDSSNDSENQEVSEKNSIISKIPSKKVKTQDEAPRTPNYEVSKGIELDEQRESLIFEFSNNKKTESLNLHKLKERIDICKTSIKYKVNDNIGWWIISINKGGYLKETTSRYTSDWSQNIYSQSKNSNKTIFENLISKLNEINQNYDSRMLQLELLDDFELDSLKNSNISIPKSKSVFKNHHKYAIISCLSSFEIIHPKEPIIGYFQGEPIYPRENVQTLKTRSQWEQDQREVKPNQKPIKIVFRKNSNTINTENSKKQEYFAEYQTQIKPILELNCNDMIPTNKYNCVNISVKGSIPDSCIHIKEPTEIELLDDSKSRYYPSWKVKSLLDIVKSNKINHAKAQVGYDRYNKPKYDGFIVKKTDLGLIEKLKIRQELTNIGKISGFIWNDIIQNLKNILNYNSTSFNSEKNILNKSNLGFDGITKTKLD